MTAMAPTAWLTLHRCQHSHRCALSRDVFLVSGCDCTLNRRSDGHTKLRPESCCSSSHWQHCSALQQRRIRCYQLEAQTRVLLLKGSAFGLRSNSTRVITLAQAASQPCALRLCTVNQGRSRSVTAAAIAADGEHTCLSKRTLFVKVPPRSLHRRESKWKSRATSSRDLNRTAIVKKPVHHSKHPVLQ